MSFLLKFRLKNTGSFLGITCGLGHGEGDLYIDCLITCFSPDISDFIFDEKSPDFNKRSIDSPLDGRMAAESNFLSLQQSRQELRYRCDLNTSCTSFEKYYAIQTQQNRVPS